MTPLEIKILIWKKGLNISVIARRYVAHIGGRANFASIRKQFSMCVNGERTYPHLQQFIAREVERPVEQLFPQRRRKAA
jgi:hypothetical protein